MFANRPPNDRLWGALCAIFGGMLTLGLLLWSDKGDRFGAAIACIGGLGLLLLLIRAR